jgi:hypothetical protein
MLRRLAQLTVFMAGGLVAQSGTTPKNSEAEYPAHARLEKVGIGAEYLVHSFSSGRDMFIAKDYLVVEVALFPAKGEGVMANAGQFSLRLNGRKQTLAQQNPEMVAASLKYPDQDRGFHPTAGLGPIVLGQPQPQERFPGDPNARTGNPPGVPTDDSTGQEKQKPVTAEELVVQAAFPEGEHHTPSSGFLYFPYRGKVRHIQSLELIFNGPAGSTSLQLPLL